MDSLIARTMIESLSRGLNPLTGQILSKYDVCSNEEIQEALLTVLESCTIESNEQLLKRLHEEKKQIKTQSQDKYYPNHGSPWTENDELKAVQLNEKHNIWYTAKVLGRTPGSIRSKLVNLGKIPNKKRFKK